MDVTIVVATFGDDLWWELAEARAMPSARAQGVEPVHVHAQTLQRARNRALEQVRTEWICYLDGDDELEAGYLDAMARGTADLRAPAVRYMMRGAARGPAALPRVAGHEHDCTADCLAWGNWLVIGTLARTQLVRDVGGWNGYDWSEDYDLWVRCWKAGATIEAVPDAVYRAHMRLNSRNRGPARDQRLAAHRAIARANGLPIPA